MPHHHVDIVWSDRDSGWIAEVPGLKYGSVHSATATETVREIEIAMSPWLEAA